MKQSIVMASLALALLLAPHWAVAEGAAEAVIEKTGDLLETTVKTAGKVVTTTIKTTGEIVVTTISVSGALLVEIIDVIIDVDDLAKLGGRFSILASAINGDPVAAAQVEEGLYVTPTVSYLVTRKEDGVLRVQEHPATAANVVVGGVILPPGTKVFTPEK